MPHVAHRSKRSRIEAGFEEFARLVISHRWLVIVVMAALTIGLGSQLPNLRVDNSDESFLRDDDPARVAYDAFREQFGRGGVVSIVFQPPAIFDLEFLEKLRAIHLEIEASAPYVAEVTSLINARNTYGDGDSLVVEDLMEHWPQGEADLRALRERVFANPLYVNRLISENESITVIAVEPFTYSTLIPEVDVLAGFDEDEGGRGERPATADLKRERPKYLTPVEEGELVDALRRIVEPFHTPDQPIYVAGGAAIDQKLTQVMNSDIARTFPLAILLIMGILALLFRRASGAILPVIVVAASVVAALGTMPLLDIPFSITLNVLPALLLTVGVCDAIHILAIFYQRLDKGDEKHDAIVFTLGHSGLAVVMTSLTTAAGLFSFITAKLAAVGNLGLIGPTGVVAAMIYSVVLLPALLAVLPLRAGQHSRGVLERLVVEHLLFPIGRFATRAPGGVLVALLLLVALGATGVAQVRFSHDGLRWFPEDDPVRTSAELIDREFKGTSSLEVVIDTGRENGLHDPEVLARFERAMRWSETLAVGGTPVDKAISLVDVVKEINQALNANEPAAYVVPEDRQLIAQELVLFENSGSEDLEDFTDSLFSSGRLTIRTPWVDAMVYPAFVEEVGQGLEQLLGDELPFELTGGARVFTAIFSGVIVSMASSYALALLIITPLLVLLVGNLKRGLLAMIPNLIPIYFTLAVMGWLGIPLDASTLLIGGVLLGVAVDDTIHFMHKFNRYYEDFGDPIEAVHQTLATTGTALLFTSLVLFAGFSIFMTTYLTNTAWFGMLCAFATVVAFLADVLIAPALMVWVSPRKEPAAV